MTQDELTTRGFRYACEAAEVGSPLPKRVEVGGRGVLICREGDALYAVDEICPHENQSMRYGVVFGGVITCPHHQYRFKLDTGDCSTRRCASLQTYPLELLDGEVWVHP